MASFRKLAALGALAVVVGMNPGAAPGRQIQPAPLAPAVPSATNLPPTAVTPNRAPLLATPFVPLPLGSVRPQGWLLTQCELQRDGLTGNAETVYAADLGTNSAWLGGRGDDWEKSPYYFKGLVALAYTLNDAGLKLKAQKWMDWLLTHQGADGYLGPAANHDWWPRMIATHALKDYYEATGDARVPVVLGNYFHYMLLNLPSRPLAEWGKARAGDEMEVALWLYNRNGDTNLLTLVNLLRQQAYDWPGILTDDNFMLYGTDFQPKHNVNVEQALKMPAVYYQVSQLPGDRDALTSGLNHLMRENGLSCGLNSGTEFLSGNASVQGVELCAVVEAMLSLETAVRITGDPTLADRLEMIAFNALPAGLTTNMKGLQYYILPNNVTATYGNHGYNQDYANGTLPGPDSGFPCCRFNFHMGWPKFVQNSWAATSDGGLAVLAYAPTVVNTLVAGQPVQITTDTSYPFEEQVRLRISVGNAIAFPLKLRIPGWATNATVTVNGQAQTGVVAGTFLTLSNTWHNGDLVVLDCPMPVATQAGPSGSVSVRRGPLVYSLRIGENWTVRTPDPLAAGYDEYEVRPATPWNYALQLDPANPGAALAFRALSTPANPFDPAQNPLTLTANARAIPGWTLGWRATQAFEPPASPLVSTSALTSVTLVPFGSQHLRVSWFPYLGQPAPRPGSFTETFDPTWSQRWTLFGGNWSARSNRLSTLPASAGGAKALAMATAFTNFNYEADVLVGAAGNAGLLFRASQPDIGADAYCGYYFGLNAAAGRLEFGWASNAWNVITNVPLAITPNTFYHLKVQTLGSRIRLFVANTNQPVVDLNDTHFSGGMVGVRDYCDNGDQSFSSYASLVVKEFAGTTAEAPAARHPFEGITVNADEVLHTNSPYLTGACIEDVNHEIYGGLDSQMIFGESFAEPPAQLPLTGFKVDAGRWTPAEDGSLQGGGAGNHSSDRVSGMWRPLRQGAVKGGFSLESPGAFSGSQSQQITFASGAGVIGIENQSLNRWGMNFVKGKDYEGYLWARAKATTEIFVALESTNGSVYAEKSMRLKAGGWQRLDFKLQPAAADPAGRFAVKLKQPGAVSLGYVFLQPGPWGRYQDLPVRKDVAEGLIHQGVTLLRYGGSLVNNPEYRWKKMIGPRAQRPPYAGHWYPYSSNGWGIFDFLNLCETAGIVGIPDLDINESPKDLADFMDYLNGPPASEWGRQRVADGHPAPYRLPYLELGNEERVDAAYFEKFKALSEVLWAKDPALILIVGDFACHQVITDPFRFTGADSGITTLAGQQKILQLARQQDREVWFDLHVWTDGPRPDSTLESMFSYVDALDEIAGGAKHKVVVFELNAFNHSQRRALANALALNAIERDGRLPITCSANGLQPDGQNDNGWDQGLLFLNPSQVWLQPPGQVTRMYSANYQPLEVRTTISGSNNDNDLDVSGQLSRDRKTLVLKVVNLGGKPASPSIQIHGYSPAHPAAGAEELTGSLEEANPATAPRQIQPVQKHWPPIFDHDETKYDFPPHSITILTFK